MGTIELNNNKIIVDLGTSFEESLKEGFYITYNFGNNIFGAITKDGQYDFIYNLDRKNIVDSSKCCFGDETMEEIKEGVNMTFFHKSTLGGTTKNGVIENNIIFTLDKIEDILTFLIEQEQLKEKKEVSEILKTYNIAGNSENDIERGLSNLSHNPFEFNGVNYASIEAFWQSLKFEEGSEEWNECITLSGLKSKQYGDKISYKSNFIYQGKEYEVGSQEHQVLMKEALREQLKQNPDKLELLLSTGNSNLIHKPIMKNGDFYPDSKTIPGDIFSGFLMELREELNKIKEIKSKY